MAVNLEEIHMLSIREIAWPTLNADSFIKKQLILKIFTSENIQISKRPVVIWLIIIHAKCFRIYMYIYIYDLYALLKKMFRAIAAGTVASKAIIMHFNTWQVEYHIPTQITIKR